MISPAELLRAVPVRAFAVNLVTGEPPRFALVVGDLELGSVPASQHPQITIKASRLRVKSGGTDFELFLRGLTHDEQAAVGEAVRDAFERVALPVEVPPVVSRRSAAKVAIAAKARR